MNILYDELESELESELSEEIESDIEYDLNDDYIDIYDYYNIDDFTSSESISILNSINSSSYDILTYLDIMYYKDENIHNDVIAIKDELADINTILADFVQYYYNNDIDEVDGNADQEQDQLHEMESFESVNDLIVQNAQDDILDDILSESESESESEYDIESYITIRYYENEIKPFVFNCIGLLTFALFVIAGCIIGVNWYGK